MDALTAVMEEEVLRKAWMEYTADMLCMIARPNYEKEIPLYSDLINKDTKTTNNMTADEIYDHVMNRLDELSGKGVRR